MVKSDIKLIKGVLIMEVTFTNKQRVLFNGVKGYFCTKAAVYAESGLTPDEIAMIKDETADAFIVTTGPIIYGDKAYFEHIEEMYKNAPMLSTGDTITLSGKEYILRDNGDFK